MQPRPVMTARIAGGVTSGLPKASHGSWQTWQAAKANEVDAAASAATASRSDLISTGPSLPFSTSRAWR